MREVRLYPLARRADRTPQCCVGFGARETRNKALVPPLDRYEEFLRKWILEGHKEWKTNVYGQCKSWLDGGLQPRAVSRDLDWGIPVPVEGAEGKVLYVWFDAPIGYISATKDLTPDWEKYWKSEDTKHGPLHRQGQHRLPLHRLPLDAQGARRLHPARQRPGQRIPEPRGRQDLHLAQLGRVAARIPATSSPARRTCSAMSSAPMLPRPRTTTSRGRTSRHATTTNWSPCWATSSTRALVLTQKYYGGKVPPGAS